MLRYCVFSKINQLLTLVQETDKRRTDKQIVNKKKLIATVLKFSLLKLVYQRLFKFIIYGYTYIR